MALNQAGGFINSAAFAAHQTDLLFSIAAGDVLARVVMEGIQNSPAISGAIGVTTFDADGFVGGLQYGAAGYGGVNLVGGTTGGASWLTWGDVSSGYWGPRTLAGLAPQNATLLDARWIHVDWRGSWKLPQNLDFYGAFGTNPGQGFNFGVNYRWYAEWAS